MTAWCAAVSVAHANHFQNCKAFLLTSLTCVRSAITLFLSIKVCWPRGV